MVEGIRYQDRDKQIFSDLAEYGVLDTETIRIRHFKEATTPQACSKKLRQYQDVGLVDSIDATIEKKKSPIYRLTQLGMDELVALGGPESRLVPPLRPSIILHRLGVAQSRMAIDDAFVDAGLAKPSWLVEPDPRLRLTGYVGSSSIAECNPDASFCARLPDAWHLAAYIEFDRSTETLDRVSEKLPGYANLIVSRAYRDRHWPDIGDRHIVRVLFVCRSTRRIENLQKAFAKSPVEHHLRYAVVNELTSSLLGDVTLGNLLVRPIWGDQAGNKRAILKSIPTVVH